MGLKVRQKGERGGEGGAGVGLEMELEGSGERENEFEVGGEEKEVYPFS